MGFKKRKKNGQNAPEEHPSGVTAASSYKRPSVAPRKRNPKKETHKTPSKRSSGKRDAKAAKRRRWPLFMLLGVLLVLVLAAGGFSWYRWFLYDDTTEFQGTWQLADSAKVVPIDGATIELTDDVAYSYTLDTVAKTINFSFGNKSGGGRYRFSTDRSQLVITEGETYSVASTLLDDIAWMWDELVRSTQGLGPVKPVTGEGVTILQRISSSSAA